VQEQGEGVLLDDMPFSAVCDWMECKPIRCEPDVPIQVTASDDSTYTAFSAKFRETAILKLLAFIFAEQPWHRREDLIQTLVQRGIPRTAIDIVLQQIVNNRLYRFKSGGQEGYLIFKNNYFLFQPEAYRSLQIPMALRIATFPIKRDEYSPAEIKPVQIEQPLVKEPTGEVLDKGVLEAKVFWTTVEQWIHGVASGTLHRVSLEVERQIELFTSSLPALKSIFIEKFKSFLYLKTKLPAEHNEIFKQICLDFVWDEFLHPTIQAKLLLQESILAGREQLVQGETMKAVRYIDAQTGELRFMCEGGVECDPELAQTLVEFANEKDDSLSKRKADSKHAGDFYGFIVPKKGDKLVFKTQDVKAPGIKLDKGKECAIVSKGHSIEKLVQLGAILEKAGKPNLQLDAGHLAAAGHIIDNSVKGCTLLDLVLRYMDALRIRDKRWFFRPIAAYIAGLRGLVAPKVAPPKKAPMGNKKPAGKKPVLKVAPAVAPVAPVAKPVLKANTPDSLSSQPSPAPPAPPLPEPRIPIQPQQAPIAAPIQRTSSSSDSDVTPKPPKLKKRLVLSKPAAPVRKPLPGEESNSGNSLTPTPAPVAAPPASVAAPPAPVAAPPAPVAAPPAPPAPAARPSNNYKKKPPVNLTFAELGLENAGNFMNF